MNTTNGRTPVARLDSETSIKRPPSGSQGLHMQAVPETGPPETPISNWLGLHRHLTLFVSVLHNPQIGSKLVAFRNTLPRPKDSVVIRIRSVIARKRDGGNLAMLHKVDEEQCIMLCS
jgi:hypothetical protein